MGNSDGAKRTENPPLLGANDDASISSDRDPKARRGRTRKPGLLNLGLENGESARALCLFVFIILGSWLVKMGLLV